MWSMIELNVRGTGVGVQQFLHVQLVMGFQISFHEL